MAQKKVTLISNDMGNVLIQDHEETSVASRELLGILGTDGNSGNLREFGTTWRKVEYILTFFWNSVFLSSVLLIKKYIRFVRRFHCCNS